MYPDQNDSATYGKVSKSYVPCLQSRYTCSLKVSDNIIYTATQKLAYFCTP